MGKVTFAEYMESFESFEKSVTSSKEAAIEFLKSIGFLDENGQIKHHNGNGGAKEGTKKEDKK
jgi:hypothetical protein